MDSVDAVVLIFLGFFAIRGFFRGIVREFFALSQIFAFILFITTYVTPFQHWITRFVTPINYWVSLSIGILLILIVFGLMMGSLNRLVRAWNLSVIDRILGFFLGLLFGIFFFFLGLRLLLFIADTLNWQVLKTTVGSWINQSYLLQTVLAFLSSILHSEVFKA